MGGKATHLVQNFSQTSRPQVTARKQRFRHFLHTHIDIMFSKIFLPSTWSDVSAKYIEWVWTTTCEKEILYETRGRRRTRGRRSDLSVRCWLIVWWNWFIHVFTLRPPVHYISSISYSLSTLCYCISFHTVLLLRSVFGPTYELTLWVIIHFSCTMYYKLCQLFHIVYYYQLPLNFMYHL